jgi:hypothetical protein
MPDHVGMIIWTLDESLSPPELRLTTVNPAASEIVSVDFAPRIGKNALCLDLGIEGSLVDARSPFAPRRPPSFEHARHAPSI